MASNYTIVDTCSAVNLALPMAHDDYDHEREPDPLGIFLQTHTAVVPRQVKQELEDMGRYDDLVGAAARNLLRLEALYTVEDPLRFESTPRTLPDWRGLDSGETAAVLYANTAGADYLLSDEFTSRGTIERRLDPTADWINVPGVLAIDFVNGGHCTSAQARRILELVERERSWQNQPYVQRVKKRNFS